MNFLGNFIIIMMLGINIKMHKNALKYNIIADSINSKSIRKNDMRTKIYQRKDLDNFNLPSIFGEKNMKYK